MKERIAERRRSGNGPAGKAEEAKEPTLSLEKACAVIALRSPRIFEILKGNPVQVLEHFASIEGARRLQERARQVLLCAFGDARFVVADDHGNKKIVGPTDYVETQTVFASPESIISRKIGVYEWVDRQKATKYSVPQFKEPDETHGALKDKIDAWARKSELEALDSDADRNAYGDFLPYSPSTYRPAAE